MEDGDRKTQVRPWWSSQSGGEETSGHELWNDRFKVL